MDGMELTCGRSHTDLHTRFHFSASGSAEPTTPPHGESGSATCSKAIGPNQQPHAAIYYPPSLAITNATYATKKKKDEGR